MKTDKTAEFAAGRGNINLLKHIHHKYGGLDCEGLELMLKCKIEVCHNCGDPKINKYRECLKFIQSIS